MRRSAWRGLLGLPVAGLVAVVGVLAFPVPASAHVTVHADEAAAPGSMARVVFRVPNESDTNPTTALEVHLLPEGAPPIPSALTMPVPGWSVEVEYESLDEPVEGQHGETISEAVAVITWTADDAGAAIQPGEFGEFPVEIGPLPEAEELHFPALQTYAGLDEPVRWIERPDPDGAEPANPAPVLRLSTSDGPDGAPDAGTDAGPDDGTDAAAESADDAAGAGVWLGLAGLIAGLAGLALGAVAFARTRR